ncbi:hypothetical protein, partial [Streptomyces sp. NPDC051657]|uniref:hypothetical protein n=1 Tax=Streptomyces sp. NPDC051657 TaxID=3154749 RepID=UPI00343E1152
PCWAPVALTHLNWRQGALRSLPRTHHLNYAGTGPPTDSSTGSPGRLLDRKSRPTPRPEVPADSSTGSHRARLRPDGPGERHVRVSRTCVWLLNCGPLRAVGRAPGRNDAVLASPI